MKNHGLEGNRKMKDGGGKPFLCGHSPHNREHHTDTQVNIVQVLSSICSPRSKPKLSNESSL
jgi:hypothetical protein